MRIRKRPQNPSCSPDLTAIIVSPRTQSTETFVEAGGGNGNREEAWDVKLLGVAGGRETTSLHHNGDLPVLDPQHQCLAHQPLGRNLPSFDHHQKKNIKVQQQPGVQPVNSSNKSLKNTEGLHYDNYNNRQISSCHGGMIGVSMKTPIKKMVKEVKLSKDIDIPLTMETFTTTSATTCSMLALQKKPCSLFNGDRMMKEDKDELDDMLGSDRNGCKKKRKSRPSEELMEGSRCSRVNGRGWRCHQQTLVGYSLCEHHLGKGRLRNTNSVRSKKEESQTDRKQHVLEKNKNGDQEEVKENTIDTTKRKKIGIVKAKSISCLLDQTCEDVSVSASGERECYNFDFQN